QFGPTLEAAEVLRAPPDPEAPGIIELVERLPRLEELHLYAFGIDTRRLFTLPTLGSLRTLVLYLQSAPALDRLADNPAAGGLTTLRLHPHPRMHEPIGLEQVVALLESPYLGGLTHLSLHPSDLGHEGVGAVAEPGIRGRL